MVDMTKTHTHPYPLLLTPIYKPMLWGGNRLNTLYNRNSPFEKTGESWDISCRPQEMGIIENGPAAGQTLEAFIAQDRAGILGTRLANQPGFPLLVKIIDANASLSVQVHPGDDFAKGLAGGKTHPSGISTGGQWQAADTGKTEMWYILTPPTDGHLIIGLKPGITPAALRTAYENGTVESCLNHLPVAAGDIINIPAGLVHALTPGVMVAEVQQNSDITYRIYDYNRLGPDGKPRDLHIEESLAVADFDGKIPKAAVPGLEIKKDNCTLTYAIANQYFAIIKYDLAGSYEEASNPAAFSIFTCVEGRVEIILTAQQTSQAIQNTAPQAGFGGHTSHQGEDATAIILPAGHSAFIPASMGSYIIRPISTHATLIKSFVPDIENDFIAPLKSYGYTSEAIASSTALDLGQES